ncbi:MAG: hypothetical protein N3B18_07745 [Desulfobacterota bacterium]|nr:hypothetical protein [Thermodesulfobacteriota bacterium]
MADIFCDCCGDFLPEGTLRYTVHVQIMVEGEDLMMTDSADMLADLHLFIKGDDVADACDIQDDEYQELTFTLCPKCRHRFMQDPFNRSAQQLRLQRTADRLFH